MTNQVETERQRTPPADCDDEQYEELEEEEATHDSDENERVVQVGDGLNNQNVVYQARPSCLICDRTQGAEVRLFRWPRDPKTRWHWCAFFELDEADVADNFDHCFICSWHFDPDQFMYSDNKIFWAPGAFPRYRLRRPATVTPFPWEIGMQKLNRTPKRRERKRKKLPPPTVSDVEFRQSKFKIEGKAKHPVAVIRIPANLDLFYEFSYNRTSHIDGTKFYSCLQCRKAKLDTKIKDCIRTIHLNGNKILSRGDPLSGHHFSCKPISEVFRKREAKMKEDLKLQRLQKVQSSPKRRRSSRIDSRQRSVNNDEEHIRWDQFVDPEDEDEEGPATEAEKASNVHVSYEVGGEAVVESSGRPPMRLRPLTQQERWTMAALRWKKQKQLMAEIKRREESKMAAAASSANAGEGASKAQQADDGAVDATNLNLLSRAAAHRDRRYAVKVMRRCGSQIAKPKCYICKMILGGAKQLAEHLLAHVQTRYQCRKCGKMDGADNGLQLRRLKLCRTCFRTAKLDHHDPLIVVD